VGADGTLHGANFVISEAPSWSLREPALALDAERWRQERIPRASSVGIGELPRVALSEIRYVPCSTVGSWMNCPLRTEI
ncbi:MAG TPA: hypothetical protein VM537_24965, partial [Anaerolineae bacterium]|nr:hypothetical protein [Anaerolineae bacterium]